MAIRLSASSTPQLPRNRHFAYAFDLEHVTSNVMHRYPKLQCVDGERTANLGVFTEAELHATFAIATTFELALFGRCSFPGDGSACRNSITVRGGNSRASVP